MLSCLLVVLWLPVIVAHLIAPTFWPQLGPARHVVAAISGAAAISAAVTTIWPLTVAAVAASVTMARAATAELRQRVSPQDRQNETVSLT